MTSLAACGRTIAPTDAPTTANESARLEAELATLEPQPDQRQAQPQAVIDPNTHWSGTWIHSDGAASGGQAIGLASTGATVSFTVPSSLAAGQYAVKLQGKGMLYNGAPSVALKINGAQVASRDLWNTNYAITDYGTYSLQPGSKLDFTFTNDAWGGTWDTDRNAIVDYVDIQPVSGSSESTTTTPTEVGGTNLWGNKYVGPNEQFKTIQSAVNAAAWGETIVVRAGTYREKVLVNKALKILGEKGAIIKGSDVFGNWWREGNYWVSTYNYWFDSYGECKHGTNWRCQRPDQVFINGQPQYQETSLSAVGADEFWVGNGKLYLGSDPWNKTVEVSTRDGWIHGQGASDVTIRGLTMMHAATPTQRAGLSDNGPRWLIEGNDISYAHSTGVATHGDGSIVRGNIVHRNGQNGITGSGPNMRVENNRISYNNTEEYDVHWEGGGTKWARVRNLTVTGNESFNNDGPGLWCDIDCDNVTFANNRVHNNKHQGIHYEISKNAVIRDNVIWANGHDYKIWPLGSGVLIQNSSNVQVYNNVIAWNGDGVGVIQGSRDHYTLMQNNSIYNNVIAGDEGNLIGVVSNADGSVFQSWTNNKAWSNRFYKAGSSNWAFSHRESGDLNWLNGTLVGGGSWLIGKSELDGVLNGKGMPLWP